MPPFKQINYGRMVSASTAWRKAERIWQAELEYEQTMGWQVASGGIDQDLKWDVGLTASKTLYPRSVVLEELELAWPGSWALRPPRIEVSKSLQAALKRCQCPITAA